MSEYLGTPQVDQQRMIINQKQREIDRLRARLERANALLQDCQDIYEDRDPPMNQTDAEKALWGRVNAHLRGEDHD